MTTIVKPNEFSAGATIVATEHNDNFDTIYDDYNGSIANANVKAGAAIAMSKLNLAVTNSEVDAAAGIVGSKLDLSTPGIIGGTSPAAGTFTALKSDSTLALASGATVSDIRDEDDMASDSAFSLATQQSIKKYVDDAVDGMSKWDENVLIYLSPHGASGSTTIHNQGTNPFAWTVTNATILVDRSLSKFGVSTLECAGGDEYLTSPALDATKYDTDLDTGDWTLDAWVYLTDISADRGYFSIQNDAVANTDMMFWAEDTGEVSFYSRANSVANANYSTAASTVSADSTWHHYRWVRSGTTMYFFLDGVSKNLTEATAISNTDIGFATGNSTISLGRTAGSATYNWKGYIGEVLLTKEALATSNFSVPTSYSGTINPAYYAQAY